MSDVGAAFGCGNAMVQALSAPMPLIAVYSERLAGRDEALHAVDMVDVDRA